MTTWTRRGTDPEKAWANRRLWGKRRYWRKATEAEALAARAVEQDAIRRTFMVTS